MHQHINQPAPVTISFLLAMYYHPAPAGAIGEQSWNSRSGTAAREWLFVNQLVDENHRVTARGRAWIERLLATPLPTTGPAPAVGRYRVRYAYASKPTVFHFVKDGPRKHRRFDTHDQAEAYSRDDRHQLPGMIWEVVE